MLKCLNCGHYSVSDIVLHHQSCKAGILVEIDAEAIGGYCSNCSTRTDDLNQEFCDCGLGLIPIFKQPDAPGIDSLLVYMKERFPEKPVPSLNLAPGSLTPEDAPDRQEWNLTIRYTRPNGQPTRHKKTIHAAPSTDMIDLTFTGGASLGSALCDLEVDKAKVGEARVINLNFVRLK